MSDKPVVVSTLAQARALPEVDSRWGDDKIEIDPVTHHTVRIRPQPKIFMVPTDPCQILYFRDADGRSMEVVYTENGPAKCRHNGFL